MQMFVFEIKKRKLLIEQIGNKQFCFLFLEFTFLGKLDYRSLTIPSKPLNAFQYSPNIS